MNANQIIDDLGGTSEVAKLCEVTTGAVSQWRYEDRRIPPAQLRYLRAIRPDIFAAAKVGTSETAPMKEAA